MKTLFAEIVRYAKQKIAIAAGAVLLGLFAGCENGSRFEGKSLEEVVSMVDSVSEAQEFINDEIDYADCDVNGSYQRPQALNGAEVQGFRRTFDRKLGVCRDGSVAIAAMLQDNGYPALVLDVNWTGGDYDSHSVFVYQDEQGNWGSAGINASDRRHSVYGSLESLARDVAGQYGGNYKGFKLYNLSLVNLIEGTNEGLVAKTPFLKEEVTESGTINYTILKTPTGFEHNWSTATPEKTSITCNKYTEDLYLNERIITGEELGVKYEEQWTVLMRAACRLPIETLTTSTFGNDVTTGRNWFVYTYDNQIQQDTWEARKDGNLVAYRIITNEYSNNKKTAIEFRRSNDGDYQFDYIERTELNPDGTYTVYTDNNADGVWDSITTTPG